MKKKTIKVDKKLVLDRETIIRLDDEQMSHQGGGAFSETASCASVQCTAQEAIVTNSCLVCSCVVTL
jgi:hypothetical protein